MTRVVMPSVGVVIANYNNEAYVAQAIESVAGQTARDMRVVVVDNCSTDDSDIVIKQTLHQLDDRRFHYVRNNNNRGQAGAIRAGLQALDTPFVCFLDSDDYLYDDFVARHVAAHLNADFPVALTFCDSHVVDGAGRLLAGTAWWFDHQDEKSSSRVLDRSHVPSVNADTGEVLFERTGVSTLHSSWSSHQASNSMASMMLRRAFVDLVFTPDDDDLYLYVDYYLSTYASLLTGTIALADALYAYRMHGANHHSDGTVLGGQYSSSSKQWEPIRNSIWRLVLRSLESEADRLQRYFGIYRIEQAQVQLRQALRLSSDGRPFRGRTKLQEFLSGL
jgi:glycosyltransferase involved in cell wall biosynthesis